VSRSHDLAFLRLLCASGVNLMTQRPPASTVLRRLVPAVSLSMTRVDHHGASQEHYSEYFDAFSHPLFASAGHVFTARRDDPAAFGNLLRGTQPFGTLIDLPPAYRQGAACQHLFQRNGIHHGLDVALRDAAGPIGILGIFRERDAPAFTGRDVATIAERYAHRVHACAMKAMPAVFDEMDSAMLIASIDGRIQWASEQACAWLEEASVGDERSELRDAQCLPEVVRELCRSWENLRQPRRSSAAEVASAPTLTLPFPGGRLRLRVYALDQAGANDACAMPAHIGIQLSLEMRRDLRVLAALERAPLTPQQRRIAFGLWQGRSPAELKEALNVSAQTLKSYQKDLYARLDVSGVTALRALLDQRASDIVLDLQGHRPVVS